jgi:broad specificity phosphatase PhoE
MTFELGGGGQIVFTESPADVVNRMTAAIDDIAAAHPGGRVIVVGHAGAFVNYLTDVMRLEPGQLRILPYYTSVSVVRALGDRRMVGALGDTAHLE